MWNRRCESPLLCKVDSRNLFFELDHKFQNSGKITALDVDIFVNTMKNPDYVDEVINIAHRLRLTAETSNTLESTHHAFIRYLMDSGHEDSLLEILHDRLNYGIFPDHYCCNLMMDHFIKKKDFTSAARVASLLMLQEDTEDSLCNALGIYSCYRYSENSKDWTSSTQTVVDPNEEVIRVRVKYLRNVFFDDHFDLESNNLVGKSLVFYGKLFDDTLGRTCILRGFLLASKYEHAKKAIETWIDQGISEIIYKEIVPSVDKRLLDIPEDKITHNVKELKIQMDKLKVLCLKDGSVIDEMEKRLHDLVNQKEAIAIINQCKDYEKWEKKRIKMLEKQMNDLDKNMRIEKAALIKRNLQERERLLTFFDREEDIELRIEQKLDSEEKKYGPVIQVNSDIEENYVPPEITKNIPTRK